LVLAFGDVVFGGRTFFYRDFGLWAYPNAFYHHERFWAGEIPLWNPLSNCGIPFLAQWNTMTLYPFSLIYLLLPLPWSLNVFCLAHLWLAGVGMYLLAFDWTRHRLAAAIAGLAYCLNGLTLHSLMWPNNLAALGWAPLVIFSVIRAWRRGGRYVVLAAVIAAVQLLAGAPEVVFATWLFILVIFGGEGRRICPAPWLPLGRVLGAGVAVLGLSAMQLLPFFELLGHSQRSEHFGDATWSMPIWGVANFVVPLFHETKSVVGVYSQDAQQWTSSYYLGIGPLAMALLGLKAGRDQRTKRLAGLAVFGLMMAMGSQLPLFEWVKSVFPPLGMMRFPIKFVVMVALTVPLLCAGGVRRWMTSSNGDRVPFRPAAAVWLVLVLGASTIAWAGWYHPTPGEDRTVTLSSALSRVAYLSAGLGWLVLLRHPTKPFWQGVFQLGLLATLGLDVLTHAPRQNPTLPSAVLAPGVGLGQNLPVGGTARAMISETVQDFMDRAATPDLMQYYLGQRRTLFANCNLIEGVAKVDGMFSLHLQASARVHSLLYGHVGAFPGGLADFLGVGAISADQDRFQWRRRPAPMPLVTAGQRIICLGTEECSRQMADPGFDGRDVVFLDSNPKPAVPMRGRVLAQVDLRESSAQRIAANVTTPEASVALVAQAHYPSWRARANGMVCPIWRANLAFQAVLIPSGTSELVLSYDDRPFLAGVLVSVCSTVACLGVIIRKGQSRET
jgi:hypothetical protein